MFKKLFNKFFNDKKFKHIVRFGCVGLLNTAFDFGVFSLLNSVFGINYIISQIASYSTGTFNSYLCNRFWTFTDTRSKNKKTFSEIAQFLTVNAASLGVSLIGLTVLLKDNSMNPFLAKILSMVLAQVVNFLGYRFWVFGKLAKSKALKDNIA